MNADLFSTAEPPTEERRAAFDVDYTPRAVPRAVFAELREELGAVRRVLIPAAGAGSWAAEARAAWPDADITAVEIRREERAGLCRWCDELHIGDIRRWSLRLTGPYDLIADNPPFSLLPLSDCKHPRVPKDRCLDCKARKAQAETLDAYVVKLRPLLARSGRLALYHLSDLAQRSAGARAIFDEHPPIYQMRCQPMRHRATGGTDHRSYSVWVWNDGEPRSAKAIENESRPRCQMWDLPILPASERRWAVVPGSETT